MKAALGLTDKKYVAKPLKRVYIEKYGSTKKPIAEATGDRRSFGFRKLRSTHDACAQTFFCLCRRQFLKAGYIFDHHLFPTEAGTPQGGIISPILANNNSWK